MPDSEEKLFSDKYSDPGFTEFDEERDGAFGSPTGGLPRAPLC